MADFTNVPEIGYWSIRGLGAPLRMMAIYHGQPVKITLHDVKPTAQKGYDNSDWFNGVKPALKAKNSLVNLPYIIDGDLLIAQTNACFTYLGRKFNMLGDSPAELVQCEQLLCELMDLRNATVRHAYGGNGSKDHAEMHLNAAVAGSVAKFELWLEANTSSDGTFFVGNRASAPDFHAWELFTQINELSKHHGLSSPLPPACKAFVEQFGALPGSQKYINSKLAGLPTNQKMVSPPS